MTAAAPETARGKRGYWASTFYPVTGGSDTYWRNEAPAKALGARYRPIAGDEAERTLRWPHQDGPLPWTLIVTDQEGHEWECRHPGQYRDLAGTRVTEMRATFPDTPGPAVFSRPDQWRAGLAAAMREQGIVTLAECDDNYLADPRHNLFLRFTGWGPEHREAHARCLASFDRLVLSTRRLRDMYQKGLRRLLGRQHLPELHVCRNSLPRADWPRREAYDGPVRVGFMGSPSHVWDVGLAFPGFLQARELGCEVVMVGYNPADPDPDLPDEIDGKAWRSERSRAVKESWGKVVTQHVRWVDPGEYRRASLPLDIGLAPLRTDEFTLGKSDAKALEFAISGVAAVLQAHPVYRDEGWEHGHNCLLASSPREFAQAVKRLVDDPDFRAALVRNARRKVWDERNERTLRSEWKEALR